MYKLIIIILPLLLISCNDKKNHDVIDIKPAVKNIDNEAAPIIKPQTNNTPTVLKNIDTDFDVDKVDDIIASKIPDSEIKITLIGNFNSKIQKIILDSLHLGIIKLFDEYHIPVKLTVINIFGIEDLEVNMSNIDINTDVLITYFNDKESQFLHNYLSLINYNPLILSLNNQNDSFTCSIDINMQKYILHEFLQSNPIKVAGLFPNNLNYSFTDLNIDTFTYNTIDNKTSAEDIHTALENIKKQDKYLIFTETNWKLDKIIAEKMKDKVILMSLHDPNQKISTYTINQIVTEEELEYAKEFRNYYNTTTTNLGLYSYHTMMLFKDAEYINNKWNLPIISKSCNYVLKILFNPIE